MEPQGINLYNCTNFPILIKTKLSDCYSYLKHKITTTDGVMGFSNDVLQNTTKRYYVVNALYYFSTKSNCTYGTLNSLLNCIDKTYDLLHIIKYNNGIIKKFILAYPNGNTLRILTNRMENNAATAIAIEDSDDSDYDDTILIKMELRRHRKNLHEEQNELVVCLKQFIIDYDDPKEHYSNTLSNILLFNNIELDNGFSYVIESSFYEGVNRKNKILSLDGLLNIHINRVKDVILE